MRALPRSEPNRSQTQVSPLPFIEVGLENSGGIGLSYEDYGNGQPVVLIHGWPLSGSSWEQQVTALLEARYRVLAYDRRGFGDSDRPAVGYDYDTLGDDLHCLLDDLDLCNVLLVGFSMGRGEVARYLKAHGSDRVDRAVFIAPIPPFMLQTSDNPEGVDGAVFDDIRRAIVTDLLAYLPRFFENYYNLDVWGGGSRISEEVVRQSWEIAAGASPTGMLQCVNAWLTDFRDEPGDDRCPGPGDPGGRGPGPADRGRGGPAPRGHRREPLRGREGRAPRPVLDPR